MPTTTKVQRIQWRAERNELANPVDRIVFDNKWIGGVPRGLILMAFEEEDGLVEGSATYLVGYCDDTGDERLAVSWAYVDATSEAEAEGIVYRWEGTSTIRCVGHGSRFASAADRASARTYYLAHA